MSQFLTIVDEMMRGFLSKKLLLCLSGVLVAITSVTVLGLFAWWKFDGAASLANKHQPLKSLCESKFYLSPPILSFHFFFSYTIHRPGCVLLRWHRAITIYHYHHYHQAVPPLAMSVITQGTKHVRPGRRCRHDSSDCHV